MQLLILSVFLALAAGQLLPGGFRGDHIEKYLFQYHSNHKLLLARTRDMCVFIAVDKALDATLRHGNDRLAVEREIAKQIDNNQTTVASLDHIRSEFHDFLAVAECAHHKLYTLAYTASGASSHDD